MSYLDLESDLRWLTLKSKTVNKMKWIAVLMGLCVALPGSPSTEERSSNGGSKKTTCEFHSASESKPQTTNVSIASPPAPAVYRPPLRGAPKTRVGGGTRTGGEFPAIDLLAPESTGFTTQTSPRLYWHLSDSFLGSFEFVVIEVVSSAIEPLHRHTIQGHLCAGFHVFDLSEHDIDLEPGRVYQWSVALVRDKERRSKDIVGIATIERQTAGRESEAWYDIIDRLAPQTSEMHAYLEPLLQQVGLDGIYR